MHWCYFKFLSLQNLVLDPRPSLRAMALDFNPNASSSYSIWIAPQKFFFKKVRMVAINNWNLTFLPAAQVQHRLKKRKAEWWHVHLDVFEPSLNATGAAYISQRNKDLTPNGWLRVVIWASSAKVKPSQACTSPSRSRPTFFQKRAGSSPFPFSKSWLPFV